MKSKFWKKIGRPYAFLLPSIIFLILIFIIPLCYSLYLSFHDYSLLHLNRGMRFAGLKNYITFFSKKNFGNSFKATLEFSFIAVGIELVLGFLIALLFNSELFFKKFFRTTTLFPMMLAGVVAGTMWRVILNDQFGLLNYFLSLFGMKAKSWLANPALAMPSLILTDVWQATPFVFVTLLAGLQSIPQDYYEAASIDGAGSFKRVTRITIPLLAPIISIVVIIRLLDAFRIFDRVWMLTKGGPGTVTMFLSVYNYRETFVNMNIGYGSAISWIVLIILLLISLLYLRLIERDKIK